MKKYHLGEFEEIVILTIGVLNNEAYSVAIKDEIESRLSRGVSMGALHTALKRLEDKGYLKSFAGDATEERAGRPKRYFEITAMGKKAMLYARTTREELWNAIPKTILQVGSSYWRAWGKFVLACVCNACLEASSYWRAFATRAWV